MIQRGHAALALQAHDEAAQRLPAVRVERRQRLVEQQQVGPGAERARQRDPLLLAAREPRHPPIGDAAEADVVEQLLRPAAPVATPGARGAQR